VGGLDVVGGGEVGDGAGQLQDPVVAAGRELQLSNGGADQLLAGLVQPAVVTDLGRAHACPEPAEGSELSRMPFPQKRRLRRAGVAWTRSRTLAESSPRRCSASFSYSLGGPSRWMGFAIPMRSSKGPEMRFR
jgi:hypothetical protein